MQINEGDGFILTNGRRVVVASVYDVYSSYNTEEGVGHDPETRVRYSHWWQDGRVICPRDKPLDEFMDEIDSIVDPDDLPDSQSPTHRRRS